MTLKLFLIDVSRQKNDLRRKRRPPERERLQRRPGSCSKSVICCSSKEGWRVFG
jgi:hypothetical protein